MSIGPGQDVSGPIRPPERSILKTMTKDIPSFPIGDCNNTLTFPGEETSLDSGLPSHLPSEDAPCPTSPPYGFLHHTIGKLKSARSLHAITV
jgi:hypothetical protein